MNLIKKYSNNETFTHYTYVWLLDKIKEQGIKESCSGTMGEGIYCVRENTNSEVVTRLINYFIETVKIDELKKFYKLKRLPRNEMEIEELIMDSIVEINFNYTGDYFICEDNEKIKDYIVIKKENINPDSIIK